VTLGRSEKMSKSKKNVVDPAWIIETYGADTARLFMLSDSPPERDLDWSEAGIDGSFRYVNRLWRMAVVPSVELPPAGSPAPAAFSDAVAKVRALTHKTIAAMGEDLEGFRFNKAVARLRELTNGLGELSAASGEGAGWALREGLEAVARLIGPMLPHLAEEIWMELGHATLLVDSPWPEADPALLVEDTVTVAVQVNGKLRATIELAKDIDNAGAQAAALALGPVVALLDGKPPRKVIVVPNRIVNVVV
jgi:leucyl-tRNA synthetase